MENHTNIINNYTPFQHIIDLYFHFRALSLCIDVGSIVILCLCHSPRFHVFNTHLFWRFCTAWHGMEALSTLLTFTHCFFTLTKPHCSVFFFSSSVCISSVRNWSGDYYFTHNHQQFVDHSKNWRQNSNVKTKILTDLEIKIQPILKTIKQFIPADNYRNWCYVI